jgi:hypothetical protein
VSFLDDVLDDSEFEPELANLLELPELAEAAASQRDPPRAR